MVQEIAQELFTPETATVENYESKYSTIQRLWKLVVSPTEAMRDIALAPDYEGFACVAIIAFVLFVITWALFLQKIHVTGSYASSVVGTITGVIIVAAILEPFLLIIRWAIKSWIVENVCDVGIWNFKTAASVTGYAYTTDIVVTIVSICITWFMVPSLTFNTSNLEAAKQALNDYQTQLKELQILYSLPVFLIGVTWKSYLGSLGVHFGTKQKCSKRFGFIVFFALGLAGLLITFFFQQFLHSFSV
jgi:hypothetical protein